jgi:hypothetical protein
VAAADVAEGVGAGDHRQAEGERHADEADAQVRLGHEVGGQHCAATAAEHEPERAEELGDGLAGKLREHGQGPFTSG